MRESERDDAIKGMGGRASKCSMCGKLFDSKKELRKHIDKNHRITDSKQVGLKGMIPSDNNST